MAAAKRQPAPFPSKDEVLAFIREHDGTVGKREIARAFQLKGQQRITLKALLKELAAEGHIERDRKRRVVAPGRLPSVTVIEAIGRDPDGELLGRPANWTRDTPPPTIYIAPFPGGHPSLGEGERVLARLKAAGEGVYEAQPMRVVGTAPRRVLGIYRPKVAEGHLVPTDKRAAARTRAWPACRSAPGGPRRPWGDRSPGPAVARSRPRAWAGLRRRHRRPA